MFVVTVVSSWPRVGLSCSSSPGSRASVPRRLPCWVAVAVAVRPASVMKRSTLVVLLASAVMTLSESFVQRRRVVRQQVEQVVGLGQGRNRALESRLQIAGAGGGGGAELVDDQREALTVGQPHDVLEQVGRNRRGGVRDGDGRAGLEHLARAPRIAVHVVLADQRLRSGGARRVGVELAEARPTDRDRDDRVERLLVEVDRLDRAGRHAGDLEVGAGDQSERVLELDLVRAGGAALRGSRGQEHEGDDGDQDRTAEQDALHLPVGTSDGSHGKPLSG